MSVSRLEQGPVENGLPFGMPPLLPGFDRVGEFGAFPQEELARVTVAELRQIDLSVLAATDGDGNTVRDKDGITVLRDRRSLIAEVEGDSTKSLQDRFDIVSRYDQALVDLTAYTRFLSHSSNRLHFDNPPRNPRDMLHRWNMPGRYPLVAVNKLGEPIGGITIADAEVDQNDHWITKVVVDPKLQNRKIGFQILFHGVEWAFTHLDMRGEPRKKLDTSVIMMVKGWERMYTLLRKLGFDPRMLLPDQVKVRLSQKREVVAEQSERVEDNPTLRFELEEWKWRYIKGDVQARMQRELRSIQGKMQSSSK